MYKKNRKAISYMMIISIIISIITLLIILNFLNTYLEESAYGNDKLGCHMFMNSVKGKPVFFGENTDEITPKLITSIAKSCGSKDFSITKNNLDGAKELIEDCWFKSAYGADIMGPKTYTDSVCIYCGRVYVKDDINNFNSEFVKLLNENETKNYLFSQSEIINLNSEYLSEEVLPKEISKDTYLTAFYHIEKSEDTAGIYKKTKRGIVEYLSEKSVYVEVGTYLLNRIRDGEESFGGVVLTDEITYKKNEFNKMQNDEIFNNCDTIIIPEKNYD